MCSIKLIVLFAVVACSLAEPPRRRFNSRHFARQEAVEDDAPAASGGYDYQAPQERLRLPIKFRQFARQEESSPGGYSYPKPTDSYGPPEEETTEPSSEYGPPDSTAEPDADSNTEASTEPQAERIQAFKFNRKNGKLSRPQKLQKLQQVQQAQRQVQQVQPQVQPIFYVQYPTEFAQPQFYYVINK
jgi:hypothetical protein